MSYRNSSEKFKQEIPLYLSESLISLFHCLEVSLRCAHGRGVEERMEDHYPGTAS